MGANSTGQLQLSRAARAGLVAGALVLGFTLVVPPPGGLTPAAWQAAGLALLMAIWWSTGPVPIGITALLPLIVLPLLGIGDISAAAQPYANPLVFLFLGGFLLAAGVQRWGLHRRLARRVVQVAGTSPGRLVLGMMTACAMLSMWISNTASVILLLPVALSVIAAFERQSDDDVACRRFALAMLLGLAYAASIGGLGTLIGTAPNALLAGFLLQQHGIDLSFAAWSAVTLPLVVAFLPLAWLVLTRLVFPLPAATDMRSGAHILAELGGCGAMSQAEWRMASVFSATAALWMLRPVLAGIPVLDRLSDPGIAIMGAVVLFLVPSGSAEERGPLLTWREAQALPWQVILLFGGGLSLAAAIESTGLANWIGQALAGLGHLPPLAFLTVVTATIIMMTELASNTATVAALLPVVAAIAEDAGVSLASLAAAVAMAASCAFMLPVATPPNALVFATGHVSVTDMLKAGLVMNLLAIVLVTLAALALTPLLPQGG